MAVVKVHHLNCISTCPIGGKVVDGRSNKILSRGKLACHCLLVETNDKLILIDTGLGTQDVLYPNTRLSKFFLTLLQPDFRIEMTAIKQIEALGYRSQDVTDIICTHLDFDHVGGLDDFPRARVHLMKEEVNTALQRKTWLDKQRFRPHQWSTNRNWKSYTLSQGTCWFGFDCINELEGLDANFALIPLPGHTFGHAGVAIKTPEKWLFLVGDAYFFHAEMNLENPYCTPGLSLYQRMMDKNHGARAQNQLRLRKFREIHSETIQMFCSHDPDEFEFCAQRPIDVPAEKETANKLSA